MNKNQQNRKKKQKTKNKKHTFLNSLGQYDLVFCKVEINKLQATWIARQLVSKSEESL